MKRAFAGAVLVMIFSVSSVLAADRLRIGYSSISGPMWGFGSPMMRVSSPKKASMTK